MNDPCQRPYVATGVATPPSTLRGQFGNPTGVLGWAVGHLMALKNARRSEWVHAALDLAGTERILELGFGSGADAVRLARRGCQVAGIDHSPVMLEMARSRLRRAGVRADLRLGDALSLPFEDGSFDRVVSINVVQFWDDLVRGACEIRRVLAPNGLAVLAIQPKSKGVTDADSRAWGERLSETFTLVGATEVTIRHFQGTSPITALVRGRFACS